MNVDSKEISSKLVTASEVLTHTAADLLEVLVTHTTGTAQCRVYDGEDTNGELKLDLKVQYSQSFKFPEGLYMRRGIYFYDDTKVQSALIRWRNRPSKEG